MAKIMSQVGVSENQNIQASDKNNILNKKFVEKITYVGDLRLIGLVYGTDKKEPQGYFIFMEKTNQTRIVSLEVLLNMYMRYKFSNIEIGSSINNVKSYKDITCLECSMDKLLKFQNNNGTMQSIEDNSIYVLGKIYNEEKKNGYRVISSSGKIVDLSFDELDNYISNGVKINNMHLENNSKSSKNLKQNINDFTITIKVTEVKAPKSIR